MLAVFALFLLFASLLSSSLVEAAPASNPQARLTTLARRQTGTTDDASLTDFVSTLVDAVKPHSNDNGSCSKPCAAFFEAEKSCENLPEPKCDPPGACEGTSDLPRNFCVCKLNRGDIFGCAQCLELEDVGKGIDTACNSRGLRNTDEATPVQGDGGGDDDSHGPYYGGEVGETEPQPVPDDDEEEDSPRSAGVRKAYEEE